MRVFSIPALTDNYIHLATGCGKFARMAVITDPGDSAPVLQFLATRQLRAAAVLITHLHYDHLAGLDEVRRVFADAKVYVPPGASDIDNAITANDGDMINVCGMQFRVMATPGHTPEHIAFYGEGVLFCGDTLFGGGCGRLLGGTAAQMQNSLQRLKELPDNTEVYFGHEYTENNLRFARAVEPNNTAITERLKKAQKLTAENKPTAPSTIAEEKATNPFLRLDAKEVITAAQNQTTAFPDNTETQTNPETKTFAILRNWKDNF